MANAADVADWDQAQAMIQQAVDTFGGLDTLVLNAGFLKDRMLAGMSEAEWDSVTRVHLKGHCAGSPRNRVLARAGEVRAPVDARVVNTSSGAGLAGLDRSGQLRHGQGRDRAVDDSTGGGMGSLWRSRECVCAGCPDSNDRRHLL